MATIKGNNKKNVLTGTALADLISGLGGSDIVYGGDGNDRVSGDTGDDYLRGGIGSDKLFGGDGNDRVFGDAGNDTLDGGTGSDKLFGGLGKDRLAGSAGNDALYGGLGSDTAVFSGALNEYKIVSVAGGLQISHLRGAGADGVDFVSSDVEFLQFSNKIVASSFRSALPSNPLVSLVTDSGASSTDAVTNAGTLAIKGLLAGATIEYSTDGGKTWSPSFTASEGLNALQVRQTDAAGNTSAASAVLAFTLDTIAPTVTSLAISSAAIGFTATDLHGPLSLTSPFAAALAGTIDATDVIIF